jgi:hypothetical protein
VASYHELPWELVDEPTPPPIAGGLYGDELVEWLAAIRVRG